MIQTVTEEIKKANSILLTTHRQCDGDGLGSELAMFHALRKIGKNVRILNVDGTPKKYDYLEPDKHIQYFDGDHDPIDSPDLVLIFDTNDKRLIEPLYATLEAQAKKIIFVDHHPVLKEGPAPTKDSVINVRAASTGELAYDIIKALDIPLDEAIAKAIYTSIAFDTQLFRYVRNSSKSHEVAIDLLRYEKNPAEVHRQLFGNFTAPKLRFLASALSRVEFSDNEQLAVLFIKTKELEDLGLNVDDSRDLIDMIMNVDTVQAAALIREDGPNVFKLSLRSRGEFPILGIAEDFGGGGHPFASGAPLMGSLTQLKAKVLASMQRELRKYREN